MDQPLSIVGDIDELSYDEGIMMIEAFFASQDSSCETWLSQSSSEQQVEDHQAITGKQRLSTDTLASPAENEFANLLEELDDAMAAESAVNQNVHIAADRDAYNPANQNAYNAAGAQDGYTVSSQSICDADEVVHDANHDVHNSTGAAQDHTAVLNGYYESTTKVSATSPLWTGSLPLMTSPLPFQSLATPAQTVKGEHSSANYPYESTQPTHNQHPVSPSTSAEVPASTRRDGVRALTNEMRQEESSRVVQATPPVVLSDYKREMAKHYKNYIGTLQQGSIEHPFQSTRPNSGSEKATPALFPMQEIPAYQASLDSTWSSEYVCSTQDAPKEPPVSTRQVTPIPPTALGVLRSKTSGLKPRRSRPSALETEIRLLGRDSWSAANNDAGLPRADELTPLGKRLRRRA